MRAFKMTSQTTEQNAAGILCQYRLDDRGIEVPAESAISSASSETFFDWVHLRSDDPGTINWMREQQLDERVIEALTAPETRPRMQLLADGVLINLRGVNTNPDSDPEDMVSVRLWFNNQLIISTRRRDRRLLSIEDIRNLIANNQGPRSTGGLVAMLVELLANRIADLVDKIDDDLTRFETDLNDDSLKKVQLNISTTRKQSAAIRRYLAPQREALVELSRSRKMLSDEDHHSLQYQTDRIIHYVEDLDLSRERALVLQSDLQNRIAEQQNSRMYLLSIVAAIFLPLSFLTGVFGMNVGGLPGLENPQAFFYLSVGMLVVASGLIGFMWWKRWL